MYTKTIVSLIILLLTTLTIAPYHADASVNGRLQSSNISPGSEPIPDGLTATEWDNIQEQVAVAEYQLARDEHDSATSPLTIITWLQQAKLTPNDGAAYDHFGSNVAVDGNTAVISAHLDDDNGSASGVVYIFIRSGTTWVQQQKITASDAAVQDYFGVSVGLSGDTAIIGAYGNDDNGNESGAAYIFTRSGTTWSEEAKLTAADAAADDRFGFSVAVNGDTAVIGANQEDDNGTNSGSAYVFTRSGTTWSQQQKLTANDGVAEDSFGVSVVVDGDTAVVGARWHDNNGGSVNTNVGAAYVFVRSGVTWSQQAKLTADDAADSDLLGFSVALSGDTALISAHGDDDAGSNSGAAYVFTRNGTTWNQQQKLTTDDAAIGDNFSWSVAVDGDMAVIGAFADDGDGDASGSAYVFTRSGSVWSQREKLTVADGAENAQFGVGVALSDDTAVIGAELDNPNGVDSGSAYAMQISLPILNLTKTADTLHPGPSETVTYTVNIENRGLFTATNGLVADDLPTELNFLDGSITLDPTGAGTIGSVATLPMLVDSLTIAPGAAVTITYQATVNNGLAVGTVLTNTVGITSTETTVAVTATETITIINLPPVAIDNAYTTAEETAVGGNVINDDSGDGVDYDPNGESFTAVLDTVPVTGTLSLNNDGSFNYIPPIDYNGDVAFTYVLSYGQSIGSGVLGDSGQSLDSSNSESIKLGDLDGDGDLDAFVANSSSQPNRVWLNNGDGLFSGGQLLGSSNSMDVSLGDLDGDGDLDAFVVNYQQSNRVWRNNGNGTFVVSGQTLGGSASHGVDLGDLDGDGDLDAFVANANNQANQVWLNNGSGLFGGGQSFSSADSTDVNLGDLDEDGDLDAFVTNRNNQANKVWLNNGNGVFSNSQTLGNLDSYDVKLGDLDGDGDLDAFVANYYQSNRVWRNNGNGFFSSVQSISNSGSHGIDLGDVDGDGDLDAFVANFQQSNRLWRNNGSGFFSGGSPLGNSRSYGVSLNDVDGDGDIDGFVANFSQANKVWLNQNAWRMSNTAVVTITVTPANDAPVAVADTAVTDEDTAVSIPVLNNDSDIDGDSLSIDSVTVVSGTVVISGTNIVYTPGLNFFGEAIFSYVASDGVLTDTATITVTVAPVNDAPIAVSDSYTVTENMVLNELLLGVLDNDSDVENDGLTAVLDSTVISGVLSLALDGSFVYTPTVSFCGTDGFTYHANDSADDSNVATVTLNVTCINDAPVAVDDTAVTDEDTAVSIPVLNNDSDIDGDSLSIDSVTVVSGTAVISGTNIVYTPSLNFSGEAAFNYVVSDGVLTDAASVTVTVAPVNDAPIAVSDSYTVTENMVLNELLPGVLDNDSDVENDGLTAVLDSTVISGVLSLALDGSFVYTPTINFCGTDGFTYHANDSADDSNVVSATFNVTCLYDLTLNQVGTGSGSVATDPAGTNCGTNCETYTDGTVVTVTYSASLGSTFIGWAGACTGTGACIVNMDATKSVTVTFEDTGMATMAPVDIVLNSNDIELTWNHASQNTAYEIWRSLDPYFVPGVVGALLLDELIVPASSNIVQYSDAGVGNDGNNYYYVIKAINNFSEANSKRIGKFTIPILPGWNLITWPLLPASTTLDDVIGQQLFGTDNPLTANRVLAWNSTTQSYESAWFCAGACVAWGEPWANHWLANDYSQSPVTLTPDAGFWIENRSGSSESIVLLGNVAEVSRNITIDPEWQLLGSAFPIGALLDDAGIPATGTEDPLTADRLLYWDAATQSYDSAWYCGGPVCESWGEPWANHWLANDYSQSNIELQAGHGFWFENRHILLTWVNSVPE